MKEKILTRNFCMAFLSLFSLGMVMYMLMSIPNDEFNAVALMSGMISGMYAVGGIFSRLASSSFMTRLGWKKVVLLTAALHIVACCGYYVSDNFYVLITMRFIHGLGFGATNNIMFTVATSTFPKSRYSEATGYFTLSSILPVALGPFLGKYIYDSLGLKAGCITSATILSILVLLFIYLVKIPNDAFSAPKTGDAAPLPAKGLNRLLDVKSIPVACCVGLMTVGYVAVMSFSNKYAETVHLEDFFSYFYLIYAAAVLIIRPFAGRMQDRHGDNVVCYPGVFAQAIGLFLVAWRPSVLTIVLCAIGCALGYGTLNSCYNAIICSHVEPRRRPFAVASFFLFCDVGLGFGPMILGSVASLCGENYRVIYYAGAALSLLAFFVYYFVWGRKGDTAHWVKNRETRSAAQ